MEFGWEMRTDIVIWSSNYLILVYISCQYQPKAELNGELDIIPYFSLKTKKTPKKLYCKEKSLTFLLLYTDYFLLDKIKAFAKYTVRTQWHIHQRLQKWKKEENAGDNIEESIVIIKSLNASLEAGYIF